MLDLVNDFGADPTGILNCDAAVNAWLATGKDCEDSYGGVFRVEGSGTAVFLQTKPGIFHGQRGRTRFLLDNNVPSTRSLFHVQPDPAYKGRNYGFEDFEIEPETQGAGIGNHGIILNTTATGAYFRQLVISGLGIHQLSGHAILSVNSNADGLIAAIIKENPFLMGGINLNSHGDSVEIYSNIIAGNGMAITATPVAGAAKLTIRNNNISSKGGAMYLQNQASISIRDNITEQNAGYTGDPVNVNSMIFLIGASGGVIEGTQMQSLGHCGCIRLVNCVNTKVINNDSLYATAAHKHINIIGGSGNIKTNNTYVDSASGAIVSGYF